ncbi:hypothetical protein KC19_2G070700 [Ceratodon purpureus]|uniref:Uncharacterized protein n=1 Tax=Ceratodon purpureus TaxID=3225 RepID=A0A8T0ITV6_CERPU|nr:hypothetical protein KC19_2G070700 [Ceratodon purpureus]
MDDSGKAGKQSSNGVSGVHIHVCQWIEQAAIFNMIEKTAEWFMKPLLCVHHPPPSLSISIDGKQLRSHCYGEKMSTGWLFSHSNPEMVFHRKRCDNKLRQLEFNHRDMCRASLGFPDNSVSKPGNTVQTRSCVADIT